MTYAEALHEYEEAQAVARAAREDWREVVNRTLGLERLYAAERYAYAADAEALAYEAMMEAMLLEEQAEAVRIG